MMMTALCERCYAVVVRRSIHLCVIPTIKQVTHQGYRSFDDTCQILTDNSHFPKRAPRQGTAALRANLDKCAQSLDVPLSILVLDRGKF